MYQYQANRQKVRVLESVDWWVVVVVVSMLKLGAQ
jgi:hypothetical protein